MNEWGFTVDGPQPVLNHSYRIVYVGARCPTCGRGPARLAKADGVESWQEAVAWQAKAARPSGWVPGRRTIIEVEWFAARAKDSDSSAKALLDGIAHGLGCDDKGFLVRVMRNEVDKAAPRTIVRVRDDEA